MTTPAPGSSVVAVIGLGYVGLPLVVEFGKHLRTIGFDVLADKVATCRSGRDPSDSRPTPACQSVQAGTMRTYAEADTVTGRHRGAKQHRRGR